MISLLLSLFAVNPTIRDCGVETLFTVDSVSLTPLTPVPAENATIHLTYTVPIGYIATDGLVTYSFTYNFIPLNPVVEPLCSNIPCPLNPGTYSNTTLFQWPTGLSGSLSTTLRWTDILNVELLCLNIYANKRCNKGVL